MVNLIWRTRLTVTHDFLYRVIFLCAIPSPIFELALAFSQSDDQASHNVLHDLWLASTYIVSVANAVSTKP